MHAQYLLPLQTLYKIYPSTETRTIHSLLDKNEGSYFLVDTRNYNHVVPKMFAYTYTDKTKKYEHSM